MRRSASLRAGLRQQGIIIFDSYPGTCSSARATRLGTVPGYYQSSRAARDWIAPFTMTIQGVFSMLSRANASTPYLSP
jgi:hypothetical protein